jgi:tRNA/tmRNA/rRNA uracil-C5-methylase (TrmA/RlmC/RlmD family)
LCEARQTRQLLPSTYDVLDALNGALQQSGTRRVCEIELSENIDASQRAVHLDAAASSELPQLLRFVQATPAISGLTAGSRLVGGDAFVTDRLTVDGRTVVLRRNVRTFFQANRYLLGDLVMRVIAHVTPGSAVIDLYAGAGLFSISAAVVRGARVAAVEGDRFAAADLADNARTSQASLETHALSVERFTADARRAADAIIADPPRTGLSKEALDGVLALRAEKILYVSCDVATFARDARRLLDGGYDLSCIEAFDLFPHTPHVETFAEFSRRSRNL